jgi:hypothetical protein
MNAGAWQMIEMKYKAMFHLRAALLLQIHVF